MATSDHFGLELQRVLPRWAKPLWANTLRENRDRGGKGGGRRRKKREAEEEERGRRKREKSKGGEPDNMPRLATKRGREKIERDKAGVRKGDEKAGQGESFSKQEEEKGKTKTSRSRIPTASRTICPGWPRGEVMEAK